MINSILRAVREIKSDVASHLQAATIERICRELNYTWRERFLGPDSGTLFSINTDGTGFAVLNHFSQSGGDAYRPLDDLTLVGSMLYGVALTWRKRKPGSYFQH